MSVKGTKISVSLKEGAIPLELAPSPKIGSRFTIPATLTHADGTSEPIEIVATWTNITQATFTYTLPDGLKAGDIVQLGTAHLGMPPPAIAISS